jgi:hypothetical protein
MPQSSRRSVLTQGVKHHVRGPSHSASGMRRSTLLELSGMELHEIAHVRRCFTGQLVHGVRHATVLIGLLWKKPNVAATMKAAHSIPQGHGAKWRRLIDSSISRVTKLHEGWPNHRAARPLFLGVMMQGAFRMRRQRHY